MPNQYQILAGWLIDGTGGPIQHRVIIKVVQGLIRSIRPVVAEDRQRGELMDFSTHTLLPGLVDCHVHLVMSGSVDPAVRQRQLDISFEEARQVIDRHLRQHMAAGVVAVRDGADHAGHAHCFRAISPLAKGHPLIVRTAGKAWHAAGRYGRLIGKAVDPAASLLTAVRGQLHDSGSGRPDHIKIVNSGLNSLDHFGRQTSAQFDPAELKSVVAEASRQGIPVMVHANGFLPVRDAIEAGCRSIEHGFFMGPENLQRLADRQCFWVPTAVTMLAYAAQLDPAQPQAHMAARNLEHQLEQLAQAKRLGVRVALGTDAGSLGVRHGLAVIEEMRLLRLAGFSITEIIQCASAHGAELLAWQNAGQLKRGYAACLLAVPGEPDLLPQSLAKTSPLLLNESK